MRSSLILLSVAIVLLGCAKSNTDAVGGDDPNSAILLMAVEEGYVFKAGKASVTLSGDAGRVSFDSLAARSGGPGLADRRRKGGIVSFRSRSVKPGSYTLSSWRFLHRRGRSLPPPTGLTVQVEARKTYYLGRFFANNLSQTSRLSDAFYEDKPDFVTKFPFLEGRDIENASGALIHACWAQEVTRQIAKGNEVLEKYVAECFE